jgi:hypothetical protein
MSFGRQNQTWRDFYEKAWEGRLQFIENLIDSGETNPIRILGILKKFQRKNDFFIDNDSGSPGFIKTDFGGEALLPSGLPVQRIAAVNGQQIIIPSYTESNLNQFIVDIVDERGPFDAIVELGCGWGERLLEIYYGGLSSDVALYGGELTQSGIALSRRLAALDPTIKAEFFQFDHLNPDISFIRDKGLGRVLVFTCHSLEQVNEIPLLFFKEVSSCARNVTCLHLEPFGFQLRCNTKATIKHREFFEKHGWNTNLAAQAERAEQVGFLQREWVSLDNFISTDGVNMTSLMLWTNPSPPNG